MITYRVYRGLPLTFPLSIDYVPPVVGVHTTKDEDNVPHILQLDPSVLEKKYEGVKQNGQKSALQVAIENSWLKGDSL